MHHNEILARLHQSHPDFVTRRARQITYVHGDVFGEAGRPIDELLFPSSGMISLVVDLNDDASAGNLVAYHPDSKPGERQS